MLHHRLSRLGLVALAVCSASCVELPIVRITIGPDGALVERAGVMPPGDEVVDGLPLGIDPQHLAVTIEGVATPPAIRLDLPHLPPEPVPDAQWRARQLEAQAAFDLAQPTIDLALQRIQLSRAVLRLMPGGGESGDEVATVVERPDTAERPVPSPAIQQGILRFVSANREQAEQDILAARRARAAARQRLIALDEELEQLRTPTRFTARLPLPGSAGRSVSLRYAVERAAWAPVYSIEVNQGVTTLVREALVDVPRDQHWTSGRLELITRSPSTDLVLKDLLVPVLELGDELVTQRMGAKRRALAKGGGTRASEGGVDVGLHAAQRLQQADGSWSAGVGSSFGSRAGSRSAGGSTSAATASATALTVLSYLGAGYDHKTANKYRTTVTAGLSWLTKHAVTGDLSSQALVLAALAEAYAMTNDPELKPFAAQALTRLAERVIGEHELDVLLYRRGPFVGPEVLGWVTLGAKSALAAGLGAEASKLLEVAREMLPELLGHADRDEAAVVRLFVSIFTGANAEMLLQEDPPPVSEWIERSGTWWREGRPELVYFANLGLFQLNGSAWALWNNTLLERIVQLQALGIRSGFTVATPHPYGEVTALAFLTLPLQVYYRYKQVGAVGADTFANRQRDEVIEEREPLISVSQAARSWPVRIDAGPARLVDGQRMRIQIGRVPLVGKLGLRAVPASGAGAWRVLTSRNPLTVPLLAGPADVVVDGERLGMINLPFTEPGEVVQLDLGRDDRVQVTRSEERVDDEAWGKRTRTYTTRIRVDSPPGLYDSIRIDESMPVPKDGSIQLVSLSPVIAPEVLDRRLIEDPVWHLDLDLRKPPVEGIISWQLRFPATVRPRIDQPSAVTEEIEIESPPSAEEPSTNSESPLLLRSIP